MIPLWKRGNKGDFNIGFNKPLKSLTFMFAAQSNNHVSLNWGNRRAKIQNLSEQDGQNILSQAVETKLVVQQMRGVNNIGYFFSLTDKAPNPGESRYLTRGRMGVGHLLLNATLLYHVKDSESIKEALSMLREARQMAK